MPLDIWKKPPVIDVVLEGLLQSFAPRSGVMIASLRRPARKVIGQAIEITKRSEPEVPAWIALETVSDVSIPVGKTITTTSAGSTLTTIRSLGLANDRGTCRNPRAQKMGAKNAVHKIALRMPLNHNDQTLGHCKHQGRPPITPLAKISRRL